MASSSPESWQTTVKRWTSMDLPRVPVAGAAPEGGDSIFGRIAGLMSYEVASGGNVDATCRSLLRTDNGKACIKSSRVITNGKVTVSHTLKHFRSVHSYVLFDSEKMMTPAEVAAAAADEAIVADEHGTGGTTGGTKIIFTSAEKREQADLCATFLVGACGMPEYYGDLLPFRLYHTLSGMPAPNRSALRRSFVRLYEANVVLPRQDFIDSITAVHTVQVGGLEMRFKPLFCISADGWSQLRFHHRYHSWVAHGYIVEMGASGGMMTSELRPRSQAIALKTARKRPAGDLPKGKAPKGGWPLLAWAHGTVGVADICAPSFAGRSPRDKTYLGYWLSKGYAVVASDYQGLGVPGGHPYLATRPAAYSMLDSVRAVQKGGFPVSRSVVLIGQSQASSITHFPPSSLSVNNFIPTGA
jgi:hypothetical protein